MDKVFHIRTFSSPNGAYQEVELDLPATDYELLDAMEQLRQEDGKRPYLEFHATEEYDYLNKRIQETDLFRLNALAKRLAELDTQGMAAFEGLVCMDIQKGGETIPIGSLIDYAHSGNCCHVVEDAVTDEELGRFLVENGFIPEAEDLSDKARKLLDYTQIGKTYREAEGGTFTGFGYVERHSELRQVYKTLDFTPKKPAYTILLEVSKGFFNDPGYDSGKTAQLKLPASPEVLETALEAVGAWDWREAGWSCLDCRAPSLSEIISDAEVGIDFLNDLAQRLADMEPKALSTYKALLEATDCKDLQSAEALMDSLDNYIFSPQYSSPAEVAKGELSAVLRDEDAATLIPHLNLYQYGQALIERCGGTLTAYGLIEREDHQPIQAIENMPSQGGMEML